MYDHRTATVAGLSLVALLLATSALPGQDSDLAGVLSEMPQPWQQKIHRITRAEYAETLRFWAEKHAEILAVEEVGKSGEDLPIFLLRITDAAVPDTDKQVCLVTSLHGGPERTGTTTTLHLAEWLLGDSPEAVETRRRQIVLLMPIVNPYAFFLTDRFGNAAGIDPYTGGGPQNWDMATLTFKALDKAPEIAAFLSVVDRYRPEAHIDLHGTGLQEYAPEQLGDRCRYQGQTMIEITGSAYSNYALRPWDWRITEAMIDAGLESGYPSDRFEADTQRLYWGPAVGAQAKQFWLGRPNFYTAQYAYAKYHTLLSTLEIGWEGSGVARVRGLLEIGNGRWQDEPVCGYPVDRVKSFVGHFVTAWGRNAEERRDSREELWNGQANFTQGILYPQTDGRDTYVVALDSEAAGLLDSDLGVLVDRIKELSGVNAEAIETFVEAGPEIKLAVAPGAANAERVPLKHGLGLRLRLPYGNPKLLDIRLNGNRLDLSPTDGYQSWAANGYTQLQIQVPPEKAAETSLFIVTCAYVPEVQREYGWQPPAEVVHRLGDAGKE
jgi:zinc carboxypeptidase